MSPADPPPAGYRPLGRSSAFLDLIGPVSVHPDGPVFGLRVDGRHLNSRNILHGGAIGPLVDVLMGYTLTYSSDRPILLTTAHLSVDHLSAAERGDWLEGHAHPGRIGKELAYGYCSVRVGDRVVAHARAIFTVRPAGENVLPPRPW